MLKKILALVAMLYAAVCFAAVDVNKASAAELDGVKGIGPAISAKIVDERKKGNFKDWNDFIARVKGVGDKNAAKLSAEGLTVNGAALQGATAPAAAPAATPAAAKKDDKPAAKVEEKKAAPAPVAAPAAEKKDPKAETKMKAEEAKAKKEAEKKAKADEKAAEKAKKADTAKPAAKASTPAAAASAAKK